MVSNCPDISVDNQAKILGRGAPVVAYCTLLPALWLSMNFNDLQVTSTFHQWSIYVQSLLRSFSSIFVASDTFFLVLRYNIGVSSENHFCDHRRMHFSCSPWLWPVNDECRLVHIWIWLPFENKN